MKEIIKKLAKTFDCQDYYACYHSSHLTKVYIGDVLEKLIDKEDSMAEWDKVEKLIVFWNPCGLSRSLQQIEEESGYEEVDCPNPDCVKGESIHIDNEGVDGWGWCLTCKPNNGKIQRLKDPKAGALAEFLNTLI